MNNLNHKHPLGKGEVESSILSGSTSYAREFARFRDHLNKRPAEPYGTKRETRNSNDGESVDSVRGLTPHADIARELRRIAREHSCDPEFARRCRQTASQITNLAGADKDAARNLRAGIKQNVEWFEECGIYR